MTPWALWTWIAAGVLVTLPVIVLVMFLRDAARMFRQFGDDENESDA